MQSVAYFNRIFILLTALYILFLHKEQTDIPFIHHLKKLYFMKIKLSGLCLLLLLNTAGIKGQSPADQVDMLMGTYGLGHCVVGPQLPHGSINPSPQTANGGHGGYVGGQPIRGFGQLHVSGTGWSRYGQILLSPQTGFNPEETGHDSPLSDEEARPYYYRARLDRYGITAELAPTHHCAIYRFSFPPTDEANILLDVAHNIPQHIVPEVKGRFHGGKIDYDPSRQLLTGWGEYSGGFGSGEHYKVYFAIEADGTVQEAQVTDRADSALYARLQLNENPGTVCLRVGISLKSTDNALRFLQEEVVGKDLESVKQAARQTWNSTLSAIRVKGGSEEEERLFYTTLYHSFLMPRDRTGDNPGWDSKASHLDDHYCIWDTWRTKYPLMVLLQESFVAKTVDSFIDRFQHNGVCNPTFTSSLDWSSKQGSDDVENVIADAIVKGVKGIDLEKAYGLMKWNAFHMRSHDYQRLSWEPETGGIMSCSAGLEYAYNDYCTAQVAALMGDSLTHNRLARRSGSWKQLFNPEAESFGYKGFVIPRRPDGQWVSIDPAKNYGSWVEYFYEGNSWTYTLFVPHQTDQLIASCGGREEMISRLSYGFDHKLISLNNEPGFLSPFLFIHCGRPDLAAYYVRQLRQSNFSLEHGYADNEDSGAMGAWYVFTSIGLFPNAGQDFYYLLPPAFSDVALLMENGKKLTIHTVKDSPDACYIKSVSLNGKVLDRGWIYHHEIAQGACITYELTNKASK